MGHPMKYGDIEGKGKIYTDTGEAILGRGENVVKSLPGVLQRGWVRYKLGWRTIMFTGCGEVTLTNKRVLYIELPEYIPTTVHGAIVGKFSVRLALPLIYIALLVLSSLVDITDLPSLPQRSNFPNSFRLLTWCSSWKIYPPLIQAAATGFGTIVVR